MEAQFDHVAQNYDNAFTHTEIGKRQRAQVLDEISAFIPPEGHILEINCGTGEDALWLSKRSKTVLATDISPEMVAVAAKKTAAVGNVTCNVLDVNRLGTLNPKTFDVIFSNFGGLNCLSPEELRNFLEAAPQLLSTGGKLVLVIMGKKSLWERVYFTLKREGGKATRRNTTKALLVNVDGKEVSTWYYSPSDIVKFAAANFKPLKTVPIGFFVAPSFMESFFVNKRLLLRFAAALDRFCPAPFANYADHFLICLEKKNA